MTLVAESTAHESPRLFFRRHLQQRTANASDLLWYLDQSVPRFAGSAEVRLAVEEIVDRLGEFVGFSVNRAERDEYAVWTSPAGPRVVVWVEVAARAIARMVSAGHTRTQLLGTLAVDRDDDLTCLYVVVGPVDERLLNEAVALRRASRHLRLLTMPALLSLAQSVESARCAHDDVLAVLRPPSALADDLVRRLTRPSEM